MAWSHTGFLIYAVLFLLLDAAVVRSWRGALLALAAGAVGMIAALPFTWELWRYPSRFLPNNVVFETGQPIDWLGFARKVYYSPATGKVRVKRLTSTVNRVVFERERDFERTTAHVESGSVELF